MVKELAALVEQMKELNGDPECDHSIADSILCEAVLLIKHPKAVELVEAFEQVDKWYA